VSAVIPHLKDALRLLYVVDDTQARDWRRLEAALDGGVSCLWLRLPEHSGGEVYRVGKELIGRLRPRGVALVVGGRADVAMALGAEGVQLGHRAPPAHRVRPWFPGWLGVSCHGEGDLKRAQEAGADYAVLSPVYGVPEKGAPLGPDLFARLRAAVTLPVVALGGIDADNVAAVRAAGANGVAVIRALRDADDPAATARALGGIAPQRV
jgi:thiamine-phosphate pyrophosphorylase